MAFIGEEVVSKVIEELVSVAIEEAKQKVRLVVGVKGELNKMTKNLKAIRALLNDAEQKQLTDDVLKLWLDELKEVSYEIDDVLDEWSTEIIKMSRQHDVVDHHSTASSSHIKKICSFLPSFWFRCGEIGLRHDIALKIKLLNESLDDISIRRERFQLSVNTKDELGERFQRRQTISYVDMAEVKGRALENKKIVEMLVGESDRKAIPKIISIVGLGGLGKTTLAQSVYNDKRVINHFNDRVWVCVSNPFDEIKVGMSILQHLEVNFKDGIPLQTIVQKIRERIENRKFLVVLDDVWNKDPDYWKNMKAALNCGLPGSTILVTTRDNDVARSLGCIEPNIFRPNHLSREDCWAIISSVVESSGMQKEKLQELQDIGLQIAEKCKGLPLAAKAFGGLLRFRETRGKWRSVLDSDMPQLGEEEVVIEKELFGALWLSYHDLSSAERQCLSYCALYPKDHDFSKIGIIRSWMSQGYLKEIETKDMRMVGEEYFRNLGACSFFQDFQKDRYGEINGFKIHDIVHDFVLFISKKECLHVEELESLRETRHLRVQHRTLRLEKFPDTIFSLKKLRSLEAVGFGGVNLSILFNTLTCLRSLVLWNCFIREVPSSIGKLVHLRQLNLSRNSFLRKLPEEMGDLYNLLILDLRNCYALHDITSGIKKLSNLRYLNTQGPIVRLTEEIGKLHGLREASLRVTTTSDNVNEEASSLGNLNNMSHLTCVDLFLKRNMSHVDGAKQAHLNQKKHLVNLTLSFDEDSDAERWKLHDEEFIQVFEPCHDLEQLEIFGYRGAKPCPSWLLSMNHLTTLYLHDWTNCTTLPPLGKLGSLTFLTLGKMEVESVGLEFLGIQSDSQMTFPFAAFPKLTLLRFIYFPKWTEWKMDGLIFASIMPSLTHLNVTNCPKLKVLPDRLLDPTTLKKARLQTVEILECKFLAERYGKDGVDAHKVSHIPEFHIKTLPTH